MGSKKQTVNNGRDLALSKLSVFRSEPIPLNCEKTIFLDNSLILGIVFYGSYQTGSYNKKSDLDLHIIVEDSFKKLYRGVKTIDGIKVEYFVKPISDLYASADIDFLIQNNALLPIIGLGDIIHDKDGSIKKLQEYVLKKYSDPLPPLDINQAREIAVIIDNVINPLYNILQAILILYIVISY